jgi:hypothetical protein
MVLIGSKIKQGLNIKVYDYSRARFYSLSGAIGVILKAFPSRYSYLNHCVLAANR